MNHVQDLMRPAGGGAIGARQPDSVDLPLPLDVWIGFRRGLMISFALFVLAPTMLVLLYLALVASPQYEAESQFVLRGDVNRPGAIGSAGAVGALNVTQEGSIFVRYLSSRSLIEALAGTTDLKAAYARDGIDWFSRLDADADADAVAGYWSRKALALVDPVSGAVTLKIRAFTSEEALAINQAVMTASEGMLNHLLDGSRRDALRIAEQDRERAAEALEALRRDVEAFRRDSGLLDPTDSGEQTIDLIFALRSQRAALSAQLQGALASLSPTAPQVRALRARLAALDDQIAALEAEMTKSTEGGNLPALISAYDALELKRGFAERSFARSELTLLRTKAEIEQWHVYLTVFSPPTLTEEAVAPTPLWTAFLVFLSAFAIWSILALLAAGTMDHRQ